MQARGYSLVEMVVVIGIISILLAIGTVKFSEYARRYRTETQTRMIYSELQKARANAVYQRRETRVKLYADRLDVYSSATDTGADPISRRALEYRIIWNLADNELDFDKRGVPSKILSICLDAGDGTGAVDSIVIGQIRMRIGKKDKVDDECSGANITSR